jgi:hypothetical protein
LATSQVKVVVEVVVVVEVAARTFPEDLHRGAP